MDIKEIKAIIDLMAKNDLSEFELERSGEFKLRVKRGPDGQYIMASHVSAAGALPQGAPLPPTAQTMATASSGVFVAQPAAPSASAEQAGVPSNEITINSPMVGTFYASSSPGAAPYIQVGQQVSEDTVVCIIEAMKVMSEIKAEVKGTISAILVENGKPVEFGRPLFRVKPV